jgi:hypothetical protein
MALAAEAEGPAHKMPFVRLLALETAKEILAEVFGDRPSEVEEMKQRRLDFSIPYAMPCTDAQKARVSTSYQKSRRGIMVE